MVMAIRCQYFFVLENYIGNTKPKDMNFNKASLWLQLHNMLEPKRVGTMVGNTIGHVEEVDANEDGVGWFKQLWIKVIIDLC